MRPRLWLPSVQNPRHRPQGEQRAWVWAVRGGGKKQPGFRGGCSPTRTCHRVVSVPPAEPAGGPAPPTSALVPLVQEVGLKSISHSGGGGQGRFPLLWVKGASIQKHRLTAWVKHTLALMPSLFHRVPAPPSPGEEVGRKETQPKRGRGTDPLVPAVTSGAGQVPLPPPAPPGRQALSPSSAGEVGVQSHVPQAWLAVLNCPRS